MAKIVTGRSRDYSLQEDRKTILDRIKENKTASGDILCISCESSNFVKESRQIYVSYPTEPKKLVKLNTYYCNLCEYNVIDDRESKIIRKKLK